ncbi:MAG: hypothetical protein Q8P41_24485 [Pseudomonadota bacterium]|nr:hypothetical protein [Pseudomonadota bacterium]
MIALLVVAPSALALQIELRAEVAADLRTIRGTLHADEPVTFVDPLAALPEPPDDRTLFRTFPGAPNAGSVTWTAVADAPGTWRFETRLPVRYGDLGVLPRDGAWANGGWYPQPVGERGEARVATWSVDVTLPTGVVGVLNGRVGGGSLMWAGTADRAALAVIVGARVTEVPVRGGVVRFVERDAHERAVTRLLAEVVADAWPLATPPDLTVVENLDLLRLARSAPDMVFLSDRTFRLSPGFLRPYHVGAVRREVAAAGLQGVSASSRGAAFADGWMRDFGAAALTAEIPAPSVRKLLGWFSWNPVIDALLYDGTLPYFADVFDEPFGGPPGLLDVLGGRIPGRAAAVQLDDLRGPGTAAKLSRRLLGGETLAAAADALGVPPELVDGWQRPYREAQDYVVHVDADGARVERTAPEDAPPEVVVVEVDGARKAAWLAGPGPDELALEGEGRPGAVRVDPGGHVRETDLANDRWPVKWTLVVNGGVYNMNPSQHTFDVAADLYFRRRNDSRNLLALSFDHDAQDLLSVSAGWVRWLGPLVDRRTRTHRLTFFAGPSFLDPVFRPTDRGSIAIGGSVGYAWDTRTDENFALSGHRFSVGVGGGFVPQSDDRWASASIAAVKLLSPHPKHVFAFRAKAAVATGDVEHRLLPLGGGSDVRAIPEAAVVGNERLEATIEYRWAPLRNASLPLPLLWVTELHLTPALDAGVLWRGNERHAAVGAAFGGHIMTDLLGAKGSLAGVTVAMPVWADSATIEDTVDAAALQLYIDFSHAF